MRVVIVTGGFDPLHSGHIEYLNSAKNLGNFLIVGVNSDDWLQRKKGRAFMPLSERKRIMQSLHVVDDVITFDDSDGSAKDAIQRVRKIFQDSTIVFANGGDRTKENIPEMDIDDENVEFVFGVGGESKLNSSSWILEEWKAPRTDRPWGYHRVLHSVKPEVKVKELVCNPHSKLSMQRHFDRKELWFFAEGEGYVNTLNENGEIIRRGKYGVFDTALIDYKEWHQLENETDFPIKIVEIQYGRNCIEEDIERKT